MVPNRSVSLHFAFRPLVLPPSFERGSPVSGVPLYADNGAPETSKQNRYRPFFVPPPPPLPPLFRRMFEKQRGGRADEEKTIEEGGEGHDLI